MRTNIVLNDQLVSEVMRLGNLRTKKDAVDLAMREFVAARKRPDIRRLRGQNLIDPSYDHKKLRRGR